MGKQYCLVVNITFWSETLLSISYLYEFINVHVFPPGVCDLQLPLIGCKQKMKGCWFRRFVLCIVHTSVHAVCCINSSCWTTCIWGCLTLQLEVTRMWRAWLQRGYLNLVLTENISLAGNLHSPIQNSLFVFILDRCWSNFNHFNSSYHQLCEERNQFWLNRRKCPNVLGTSVLLHKSGVWKSQWSSQIALQETFHQWWYSKLSAGGLLKELGRYQTSAHISHWGFWGQHTISVGITFLFFIPQYIRGNESICHGMHLPLVLNCKAKLSVPLLYILGVQLNEIQRNEAWCQWT